MTNANVLPTFLTTWDTFTNKQGQNLVLKCSLVSSIVYTITKSRHVNSILNIGRQGGRNKEKPRE